MAEAAHVRDMIFNSVFPSALFMSVPSDHSRVDSIKKIEPYGCQMHLDWKRDIGKVQRQSINSHAPVTGYSINFSV